MAPFFGVGSEELGYQARSEDGLRALVLPFLCSSIGRRFCKWEELRLIRIFVDAFQVLGGERCADSRLYAGKLRTSTKSGLLSDISFDAGGGMLEVQMEAWSPLEAMSGLQERLVQDAAVLTDGDFEDEVLVRRPAAGGKIPPLAK